MSAVRHGLRRLVCDRDVWPCPTLPILRNRLLDEAGGDARPLVNLLVRAAQLDIPDRLPAPGVDRAAWQRCRGTLVLSLVADGFIQPEWAQWAVETWAFALGIIGEEQVAATAQAAPPAVPSANGNGTPRPVTGRGAARPPAARALRPMSPSGSSAPSHAPQRTIAAAALRNPVSLVSIAVGAAALLYLVGSAGAHLREKRRSGSARAEPVPAASMPDRQAAAPVAAAALPPKGSVAPGIPSITQGALPAPADSSDMMFVVPPTRARGTSDPSRYPAAYMNVTTMPLDRIELRAGKVLVGRVEVIRASTVQFRDGESGLRYEFQKKEIKEIVTEFGTRVRFTSDGLPTNERRGAFTAAGFQGTYSVRYGTPTVRGSEECGSLWSRLPGDDRAVISHVAGADTLTIAFTGGSTFTAVVDDDGLFTSSFVIVPDQARSSSAIITRMEGRLRNGGFDATIHLLGYRRMREGRDVACHSSLPAVGTRDGEPPASRSR